MTATLATFIALHSVTSVFGISCYHCTIRPQTSGKGSEPNRLCSKFNQSSYFQVDCPNSRFCLKKTFSLPLLHDKNVEITMRGCAPQSEQTVVDNQWQMKVKEGIYSEGCKWTDNSDKQKINTAQICYCNSHLCNAQPNKDTGDHVDIISMILVYNALKYVRSFL